LVGSSEKRRERLLKQKKERDPPPPLMIKGGVTMDWGEGTSSRLKLPQ